MIFSLLFLISTVCVYAGGSVQLECKFISKTQTEVVVMNKEKDYLHILRTGISAEDLKLLEGQGKTKFVKVSTEVVAIRSTESKKKPRL